MPRKHNHQHRAARRRHLATDATLTFTDGVTTITIKRYATGNFRVEDNTGKIICRSQADDSMRKLFPQLLALGTAFDLVV